MKELDRGLFSATSSANALARDSHIRQLSQLSREEFARGSDLPPLVDKCLGTRCCPLRVGSLCRIKSKSRPLQSNILRKRTRNMLQ